MGVLHLVLVLVPMRHLLCPRGSQNNNACLRPATALLQRHQLVLYSNVAIYGGHPIVDLDFLLRIQPVPLADESVGGDVHDSQYIGASVTL